MRLIIMLKKGAFGAILRGRRHHGRHRCVPASREPQPGTSLVCRERQTATPGHSDLAAQDFYVVSPHVPVLSNGL